MSARVPTRKQYRKLLHLGTATVLAPNRREWVPLQRNGWVRDNELLAAARRPGQRFLPPQQITPNGLRALADAMERYEGEGDDGAA